MANVALYNNLWLGCITYIHFGISASLVDSEHESLKEFTGDMTSLILNLFNGLILTQL